MISFKSRNEIIRNADKITRNVNSIYPHISESKTRRYINQRQFCLDLNSPLHTTFSNINIKNSMKLSALRMKMTSGFALFKNLISALKDYKFGNCYEAAKMAEILGKINGQGNIYPMKILLTRNSLGNYMVLDHVVAVITDKQIMPNYKYALKNKSAVILDPWLGITDFADKYVEKLKNDFGNLFDLMPQNDFTLNYLRYQASSIKEFKNLKKGKCFNPDVKFLLHEDELLNDNNIQKLKTLYPELIMSNFKKVVFC